MGSLGKDAEDKKKKKKSWVSKTLRKLLVLWDKSQKSKNGLKNEGKL